MIKYRKFGGKYMYNEYIEQLKKYLHNNKKLDSSFGKYSKIYSMTTENISEFLSNYDIKNKDILTVAGSGDQRLNAYLHGAKNVTCFDINPLTYFQMNLKDSIICNVNFEKFINFFGIHSNRYSNYYKKLDPRIFNEIVTKLDKDTFSIFNYLINENFKINNDDIYFRFDNNLNKLKKMNSYLNQDSYYKLREILELKKVNFINCNILSLRELIGNNKYDLILLSNLSDYTHKIFNNNDLLKFRDLIDTLTDNLNDNGIIQVGYIYSYYGINSDISNFNKSKIRRNFFPSELFDTSYVESYCSNSFYDKVITYKKKK